MRPGQVAAEEREVGIRDRVDAGPHEVAPLGAQAQVAAAKRDDPRLGGRPGRDRQPVGPGARAADHEPGSVVPRSCSTAMPSPRTCRRRTPAPVTTRPAGQLDVGGIGRRRRAAKSTTPVSGECRAATPRACGSISRDLIGPDPAQAGHLVLPAAALELVEPGSSDLVGGDDQLAARGAPRSRARRSRRRAAARPRRRAAPSASRARSRCRRGSRRWSGRSGGPPAGPRARARRAWSPGGG